MSKSYIGRVILSARSDSYHLSVEGGQGLFIDGTQFDAPSGSPTNGRAISVSDVDGLTISNCSFYSGMANPGANSRGIIDISKGRHIVIHGNQFIAGPSQPQPSDIALVLNSGPDPVKMAMNGFPGYSGIVEGKHNVGRSEYQGGGVVRVARLALASVEAPIERSISTMKLVLVSSSPLSNTLRIVTSMRRPIHRSAFGRPVRVAWMIV